MKVNLKCVEARNIPVVDLGGNCDIYCEIEFSQQKVKTRTININSSLETRVFF